MIRVGTTSWGEKTLIESGRFYPPTVKTSPQRLAFYASRFPITEIDTSYYGIPRVSTAESWARHTPGGFSFDIKAFRLFTRHRTPRAALPPELRAALRPERGRDVYYDDVPARVRDELWSEFRAALEPLARADKLGVVLLQFAPWFVFGPASFEHLAVCATELQGYRVAVEMRNKSWFSERHAKETLELERTLGLAHVVVDEPQGFASSVPRVWAVTHPEVAVVRLHGQNRAMWHGRTAVSAAERFDYLYAEAELHTFVEPVRRLADEVRDVHVLFNNCHRDNAQRNARRLQQLLDEPRLGSRADLAP